MDASGRVHKEEGRNCGGSAAEHVVLVIQENHSFDSYLGMLPHRVRGRRRVDGFRRLGDDGRPQVVQEDAQGQRFRAFPMPNACQLNGHPGQNWIASHTAYDNGRLDGFVRVSGEVAVGYWDDRTLPCRRSPCGTPTRTTCGSAWSGGGRRRSWTRRTWRPRPRRSRRATR
jgi:phospholipase C